MSRKYQGLVILNPKEIEGSVDEVVSAIAKEIETEGAKVTATEQLGRRKFVYTPKKVESGHYVTYDFTAEPAAITKITARLALNEKVFQQNYQRA